MSRVQQDFESRFRKLFPEWDSLSFDDQQKKIDDVLNDAKDRLRTVRQLIHDHSLLYLGIALGILGNIWASIFHEFFRVQPQIYIIVTVFLTGVAISYSSDFVLKNVNKAIDQNSFLKAEWPDIKGNGTRFSFHKGILFILAVCVLMAGLWWLNDLGLIPTIPSI